MLRKEKPDATTGGRTAPGIDMNIYLVPVGPERYELYCEVDDHHAAVGGENARGWRQRASGVFHRGLAYIDSERRQRLARASAAESRTRGQRIRDRVIGWLAERVAEQRLLWHLRSQTAVTAHHPDDRSSAEAEDVVQRSLRSDGRRHLVWMLVDAFIYLASLPLTPIPGPNVLALYFSFRAAGHLLSWMGARHGLRRVQWQYAACAPLTTLRHVPTMNPSSRETLAREVAAQLTLRHLDTFVERIALAGSWYTRRV
jgi:hypothetical protein